ncbi:MAG: YadA-like family protein [Sodalis sp. (in: enterobacteria)]
MPHAAIAKDIVEHGLAKSSYTLGNAAIASRRDTTALGYAANASVVNSTALGSYAMSDRKYSREYIEKTINALPKSFQIFKLARYKIIELSVGGLYPDELLDKHHVMKVSQMTNVAPATEDTDAVNLFQAKSIIKNQAEKLQSESIEAYKKEINELKDEASNTLKEINSNKKGLIESADYAENYQKESRLMFEKIQNNTAHVLTDIYQDDDGAIHIGKTLQGTTLSVAGNQGNRVISGVSEGLGDNDIANIAQLNRVHNTVKSLDSFLQKERLRLNSVQYQLFKINTKVERGLAASAALTGLFQPYSIRKVNITAGIGGYESSQAIALGSGYRITDKATVKVGLAYSGGNNLIYNVSCNLAW